MKAPLESLLAGQSLTREQAKDLILKLMAGEVSDVQIGAVLTALRMKEETAEELLGFIDGLATFSKPLVLKPNEFESLIDVCGTGGDRSGSFNVSTGVAIVLASAGVAVAKHGNRGVSSQSGSADVLEKLGMKSDLNSAEGTQSLRDFNLSFLFAPAFYPVLAKIAPARKNLGVYTIFNALGPLLNPAPLTQQMIGVYDEKLLKKMATVLQAKKIKEAFIIHGSDGLDELTLSGPSAVAHLKNGKIDLLTLTPEEFGLTRSPLEAVRGGNAEENAKILIRIFEGEKSAKRDLVLMNAAAALVLVGREENFKDALQLAAKTVDSGITFSFLKKLQTRAA
jgi:anthranilate phosphoribosyltransferase